MKRRNFLKQSLTATAILATPAYSFANASKAMKTNSSVDALKFQMDLCGNRVGIEADQEGLIELAKKNGFGAVQPIGWQLVKLEQEAIEKLNLKVKDAGLVWSAADLPVDFRKTQKVFDEGLKELPKLAGVLKSLGISRMGTWIMPCHDELTYVKNFRQHATRLAAIGKVLEESGISLGLEYVGTKSLWTSKRYPFLHTMNECLGLIEETGRSNLGLVLDSWHWTMAGENADDIRSLKNEQIIACDLNDAPSGIESDKQHDTTRELPMATG